MSKEEKEKKGKQSDGFALLDFLKRCCKVI